MFIQKAISYGSRLLFLGFFVLTSVYCLLAYIPFAYFQFLKFNHLATLTAFVKFHPLIFWAVVVVIFLGLREALRAEKTRNLTRLLLGFLVLTGVALSLHPALANIQNNFASFVFSILALIPVLLLILIDWKTHIEKVEWTKTDFSEDRRIFFATVCTALFVALLYTTIFTIRQGQQSGGLTKNELMIAASWSLVSHLLLFTALFVAFNFIRAIARLSEKPAKTEFLMCNLLGMLMMAYSLRTVALAGISFYGLLASLYSYVASFTIVGFIASLSLRLYKPEAGEVRSGLAFALLPFTLGRIHSPIARAIWVVTLMVVAYLLAVQVALFDWNFLAQKLTVNLMWVVIFAFFYAVTRRSYNKRDLTYVLLVVAALSLGFYKGLNRAQTQLPALTKNANLDVRSTLERYAGQDISFRLINEILTPVRDDGSFFRFLQKNTNIPQATRVDPVDIKLVSDLQATKHKKPNIFIFTIDSLRQDYLSAYNAKVNFTPSLDAFARESIVMENAFTHYGATGLSEPSIWVGGMSVHKQYVTPFHPMNTLQKLIESEGYQAYISMDTILSVVVKPEPYIEELNDEESGREYELCGCLKSLQTKIEARADTANPLFVYTQPQNIHVSVINRQGQSIVEAGDYTGFYAPYASRVKKIDRCFGEFVEFLKRKEMYDNSVIVFTSDHGDSLGENGRWGHAYTIYPEIIRIPLIIHLPPHLQKGLVWNTQTLAFSTDITPSLYYLFGHRNLMNHPMFGRPLFTESEEEQSAYLQPWYLISSSYGAVYGILSNNGRSLYISDAVNYADYFYDLEHDPAGTHNQTNSFIKMENEKLIREGIEKINEMYRFNPAE
ncbi:MAG: sulfatase-like hydrolase/transferase [Acidobacteriota bacterium]